MLDMQSALSAEKFAQSEWHITEVREVEQIQQEINRP